MAGVMVVGLVAIGTGVRSVVVVEIGARLRGVVEFGILSGNGMKA